MVDAYSTHAELTSGYIHKANPQIVFEFGPGLYSTQMFVNHCKRIVSVEMQSAEWYETVRKRYDGAPGFSLVLMLDPWLGCDLLRGIDTRFDLVFVDGHGHSRERQVIEGYSKATSIIAHDTEAVCYGWGRLPLPAGWYGVEVREHIPWTTFLTQDKNLYEWALRLPRAFPFTSFETKEYCR